MMHSDHLAYLRHGAMPYDDDEPDAVDLTIYDSRDALRRIEFEESLRAY